MCVSPECVTDRLRSQDASNRHRHPLPAPRREPRRHARRVPRRHQLGLRGSGYTNPRYPARPKDVHLENLENEHTRRSARGERSYAERGEKPREQGLGRRRRRRRTRHTQRRALRGDRQRKKRPSDRRENDESGTPPRGGTKNDESGPWATAALTSAVFTCRPSRPERWRLVRRASQPGRCGPRVSQLSHSRCVGSPGRRKHEQDPGALGARAIFLFLVQYVPVVARTAPGAVVLIFSLSWAAERPHDLSLSLSLSPPPPPSYTS